MKSRAIPLIFLFFAIVSTGLSKAEAAVTGQLSNSDPIESCTPSKNPGAFPSLAGLNLSVAEFGSKNLPGKFGKDYAYPKTASIDYWLGKGFNAFRIPFKWERLQHQPYANFNADELKRLSKVINHIIDQGGWAIVNPHNYARYYKKVIGDEVDVAAFADFWTRLAREFQHERIIYGLMNEPFGMSSELWRDNANAAIAAIRATGAENLILVPGTRWTGAHSWLKGDPSNGDVMRKLVDPGNNMAFEVHQYLDGDSSGTNRECVSSTIGSKRLVVFTEWLREHNHKGFLGEFAGGTSSTCMAAVDDMLNYMDKNKDLWIGWTWWAGGPWWGNYMFSIEPKDGKDDERVKLLQKHINP